MKKLLFSFVLFSSFVHAGSMNVLVRNFNFTYSDPHGTGTAESFTRSQTKSSAVQVDVNKFDTTFKLSVSGSENHEFELENAPSFMTEADTMSVSGFNLNYDQKLTLSLGSGRFNSEKNNLKLDNLSVDCDKVQGEEIMDQLISGCLQRMNFKSSKFSSQVIEESLEKALSDIQGEEVTVNSVDLKFSTGKYSLSADVKASVSGKVKSNGTATYDVEKGILTLKISEVKFSILNITSKVFDELEKKETEKFVVSKPYVYISIK